MPSLTLWENESVECKVLSNLSKHYTIAVINALAIPKGRFGLSGRKKNIVKVAKIIKEQKKLLKEEDGPLTILKNPALVWPISVAGYLTTCEP